MTEETVPRIRQRVHISQTAKGLHQVECTVEVVDEPNKTTTTDELTKKALEVLQTMEKKLKDDKRKLATEESS